MQYEESVESACSTRGLCAVRGVNVQYEDSGYAVPKGCAVR